ncbi:hypothetical protein MNVM_02100 [Mycobacterium novum]|uniref:Uncharacterized protein n=1 Tax=Mycobacterium novum TaxID=2492438 RepID=A0A7I7JIH4_9MYCO|nr:hypothetical protein [Mycobacterium novum]BBX11129.1 hypothetical protein MNVM_02100 [Mycobacterium novum]
MTDSEIDLVDGTVLAYQASPHEGLVYVTVTGPDEDQPMIVMFDRDDLDALNRARTELKRGPAEPDPGSVLQILAASRADQFVYDRVEYRYNALEEKWLAWGRVDIDEDCAPDGELCTRCNGYHNPQPGTTFVTARNWWSK